MTCSQPILHVEIHPIRSLDGRLFGWDVDLVKCESQTEPRVVLLHVRTASLIRATEEAGRLLAEYIPT